MSLLDRARRFAASGKTALVILPLAAALTAQAEVIFQFNGGGASGVHGPSGGGGRLVSFNASGTPLPSYDGIQGVKLYGDAVWDAPGFSLNLYWIGQVFRTENEEGPFRIPYQWSFSVQQQGAEVPIAGYRLLFFVSAAGLSQTFESRVDFSSPMLSFDTSGSAVADVSLPLEAWSMDLDLYPDNPNINVRPGETLITLTVPQNSVDINPTPEPESIWLLAGGAGLLLIRRRKP